MATQRDSKPANKDGARLVGTAVLLAAIGFLIAYQFVDPAPPRRIVIATGAEDGAYYGYAEQYRKVLARNGIDLELRSTAGSAENVALLEDPDEDVDVAFVQGGIGADTESELRSLASVFYEPFWMFFDAGLAIETAADLAELRVAIGEQGSGTRAMVRAVLAANGIDSSGWKTEDIGGSAAADALLGGDVDVACWVASYESEVIQRLLKSSEVELFPVFRAEAYVRRHHFLSRVTLPRGVVDLALDLPRDDVPLVAPVAALVGRPSLHPALVSLLLQVAEEVNGPGGILERPGEFPSPEHLTYPIREEADRYFEKGRPFLQRSLGFWVANFVDRMLVMLIPLLTLAIPLFRLLPPIYRWRIRSRIYRHYRELIGIESELSGTPEASSLEACEQRLQEIEEEISGLSVPLSYADSLYHFRLHLRLVLERIDDLRAPEAGSPAAERESAASRHPDSSISR